MSTNQIYEVKWKFTCIGAIIEAERYPGLEFKKIDCTVTKDAVFVTKIECDTDIFTTLELKYA